MDEKSTKKKTMNKISAKIDKIRSDKGWSIYRLSQESLVPPQSIDKWFYSGAMITIPVLEKVCDAFGITLAEFFSDGELVELTDERKELFADYISLNQSERNAVHAVINAYKSNKK